MALVITCEGCAKKLRIPETLAGKTVKCPGCGCKLNTTPKQTNKPEVAPKATLTTPATDPPTASKNTGTSKKNSAIAKDRSAGAIKKPPAAPTETSSKPSPTPLPPSRGDKEIGVGMLLLFLAGGAVMLAGAAGLVYFAIWYFTPGPEFGILTGTVTFEGMPVAAAELHFVGESNAKLTPFTEVTNAEGKYGTEGKGRPVGKYKVTIRKAAKDGALINMLPPHYNDPDTTTERAVITAGSTEANNFDLKAHR